MEDARTEEPGYDLSGDPRAAARVRRRRTIIGALSTLAVLAVGVGVLAGLDEIRERRADAVLPELAEAMARIVAEHPEGTTPGADDARNGVVGWNSAAAAFHEAEPVELPEVGVFVLADLARSDTLLVCVQQDPWLGGEALRCLPLDDPGAEAVEAAGGGTLYVLGPDSELEE